jgi:hypothetical protein
MFQAIQGKKCNVINFDILSNGIIRYLRLPVEICVLINLL